MWCLYHKDITWKDSSDSKNNVKIVIAKGYYLDILASSDASFCSNFALDSYSYMMSSNDNTNGMILINITFNSFKINTKDIDNPVPAPTTNADKR